MVGVTRRDEASLARAGDEGVALERLHLVVMDAEQVGLVDPGVPGLGEIDPMVVLRVGSVAPRDLARLRRPQEGKLLHPVRASTEVREVDDVDALRAHEVQDRLAQQCTGLGDRDRTEPGDLARLLPLDMAPHEGIEVDSDHRQVLRLRGRRGIAGDSLGDEREEGIERVGVAALAPRPCLVASRYRRSVSRSSAVKNSASFDVGPSTCRCDLSSASE